MFIVIGMKGDWGLLPESQESGSSHRFLHTEISAQEAPLAHRLSHSQGLYPGLPRWLRGKEPACQYRRPKRLEFDPWVGKIPWRRNCQPTPVFLPRKFHGQRSLMGYSPRGHKESDTTEHTRARTHTHTHTVPSSQRIGCSLHICSSWGGAAAKYIFHGERKHVPRWTNVHPARNSFSKYPCSGAETSSP